MDQDPAEVLAAALSLPVDARAALAGSLIDSLDEEPDENVEAAWQAEIRKRIEELDSGRERLVPWAEARRLIFGG